ncbi:MAG: hypothetical protein LC122_02515 [Chitinophagales bacterium]|nr:hypothetical protein [Chitinophagales bacterium]
MNHFYLSGAKFIEVAWRGRKYFSPANDTYCLYDDIYKKELSIFRIYLCYLYVFSSRKELCLNIFDIDPNSTFINRYGVPIRSILAISDNLQYLKDLMALI